MGEQDRVRQAAAEAEATMSDPLPEDAPATRPNRTVPVSVRLSPTMVADIEALAQRLDVPSSTLLRGWIQEGLAAHHETTVAGALDQLAADLQRLRQIVA
ncbi:MAG: BrnA antitoxin family protein [Actinomycetales bacterium]|nr:BrnA antitoxin family protein [Actinomycetales bacterium]